MPNHRARNGKYVSKADCQLAMKPIECDMATVKEALVGKDLRGGLVKDVNILTEKVQDIRDDLTRREDISLAWKLTVFGALAAAIVALVGVVVELL